MSREFFSDHKSMNSKPMSLLKIFIVGNIFAFFLGIASSAVSAAVMITVNIIILFIIDHHLKNNYDNIEILALQIEKLQTKQNNSSEDLPSS